MRIVAVVPVKATSERVENKNFKQFFGDKSLFEHKLEQLKKADVFDEIYVSSDSATAEEISESVGVKFVARDKYFCNNIVPWSDVIHEVVSSLPETDETTIAWCHTTSPLFNRYDQAIAEMMSAEGCDGLVSVQLCNEFIVSEHKIPVNYAWGNWHKYSQELPNYYFINGALFVAKRASMMKNRYVISTNPYFFKCNKFESIDIDDDADFKVAQLLFRDLMGS